jgi:hypothetical protein
MKFSSVPISSSEREEFEHIARDVGSESGYVRLSTGEIPSAIPLSLRSKLTGAMMMWEQSTDGSVYLIFNGVRLDAKDNTLDQEPFGVAVNSSGADSSGVFIHHGDWEGRTVELSTASSNLLESTSLGQYFPLVHFPDASSGPLSDLAKTSHEGAFNRMMAHFLGSTGGDED